MSAADDRRPSDVVVELPPALAILVRTLKEIRAEKADVLERERAIAENIKAALGEQGTVATVDGRTVATWRWDSRPRVTFDKAGLAADYPELAEKYAKVGSPARKFLLTED